MPETLQVNAQYLQRRSHINKQTTNTSCIEVADRNGRGYLLLVDAELYNISHHFSIWETGRVNEHVSSSKHVNLIVTVCLQ